MLEALHERFDHALDTFCAPRPAGSGTASAPANAVAASAAAPWCASLAACSISIVRCYTSARPLGPNVSAHSAPLSCLRRLRRLARSVEDADINVRRLAGRTRTPAGAARLPAAFHCAAASAPPRVNASASMLVNALPQPHAGHNGARLPVQGAMPAGGVPKHSSIASSNFSVLTRAPTRTPLAAHGHVARCSPHAHAASSQAANFSYASMHASSLRAGDFRSTLLPDDAFALPAPAPSGAAPTSAPANALPSLAPGAGGSAATAPFAERTPRGSWDEPAPPGVRRSLDTRRSRESDERHGDNVPHKLRAGGFCASPVPSAVPARLAAFGSANLAHGGSRSPADPSPFVWPDALPAAVRALP
jgi:hypothetical protein